MDSVVKRPLLPDEYVKSILDASCMRGFSSQVFSKTAQEHRVACNNWTTPCSPDYYIAFGPESGLGSLSFDLERTLLHLAAATGDVLWVSELIRLGSTIDKGDKDGLTPLCYVAAQMALHKRPFSKWLPPISTAQRPSTDMKRAILRHILVARVLVEQHADVNGSYADNTTFEYACFAQNWVLIKLLLIHGAKSTETCFSAFETNADKERLATLIQSTASTTRPPRLCPCWSGKLLQDCHIVEQEYPLKFLCACGSNKSYLRCCHARSAFIMEKWNQGSQRIVHYRAPEPSFPKFVQNFLAQETSDLVDMSILDSPLNPSQSYDMKEWCLNNMAGMASCGLLDPAFLYVLKHIDPLIIPRPSGRRFSKHLAHELQQKWNAIVDEYIAEGEDPRSSFEVERAAKIGYGNGALIRVCEAEECDNVEEGADDKFRFRQCSGCHISVYCSSKCQRSAWPTHKKACGSDTHLQQMLPSQTALFADPAQYLISGVISYELADSWWDQMPDFVRAQQ